MPPFQYQPFDPSAIVPSIASLIARSADPQMEAARNIAAGNAHAAEVIAAANAHAREVSGDVWGRAITNLGQLPTQIMAQQRENRTSDQLDKLRQSEIDKNAQELAQRARVQKGQDLLGGLVKQYTSVDPTTGVRQTDHQAVANDLTQAGYPDAAEGWLKTTTANAKSIDELNDLRRKTATTIATAVGHAANDASDQGDFLARIGHLNLEGVIDDPTAQKFAQEAQQDWPTFKKRTVDWASSFSKPIEVKNDTALIDPITHKPVYEAPKKLTNEAELAADAATVGTPQETPSAKNSVKALETMRGQKPRSEQDQALDAYAKSIGKTKAEDLTDADRQAFVKRDAQAKAETAFNQHVREHMYDAAHPAPVKGKSQDELEQEGRGVLQREFSSRSGGLGTEDAKVNQAIHLVTLMDQYEGKPMPAQIHGELALGLARLTSPNGQVGIELEREFKQKTAEEGIAKAVAYITGDPTLVNATPEKLRDMLRDSITRQGHVAEENRQTYLNAMLNLLPTQLEASRRAAISKSVTLNKVDTVQMQAPNGQTQDVPRNQIEHYKSRGAKVIGG